LVVGRNVMAKFYQDSSMNAAVIRGTVERDGVCLCVCLCVCVCLCACVCVCVCVYLFLIYVSIYTYSTSTSIYPSRCDDVPV
jgi:hypothetical protein